RNCLGEGPKDQNYIATIARYGYRFEAQVNVVKGGFAGGAPEPADEEASLRPEDVESLAMAAQLSGRDAECNELLVRAHQDYLSAGNVRGAARCTISLGFNLSFAGEYAQAGGWLARARRLLADQPECVEHGYLLLPEGFRCAMQGETDAAAEMFQRAA